MTMTWERAGNENVWFSKFVIAEREKINRCGRMCANEQRERYENWMEKNGITKEIEKEEQNMPVFPSVKVRECSCLHELRGLFL